MSGIAEVLLNLGYQISGSDLKLSPITERLAAMGARSTGPRRLQCHRRARPGGELRRGRAESRSAGSAPPADPRDPPRRTAGGVDAPEVRHRRRRQPRQNHHHFDDRHHPQLRRPGPHRGGGRQRRHHGRLERARGPQRFSGGGIGRKRRLLPQARAHHRRRHQYRPRAPGPLPVARRHSRRLHRVRQQGAVLRRGDRLPGRRQRAEPFCPPSGAAPSPTAPARRPIWRPPRSACGAVRQRFPAALPRRRSGPLPSARARPPQRAERHGRRGGRAGTGSRSPTPSAKALATFSGVDRRFQMRGEERGITVVDDYGHHPTEIRATLDAARLCGFRRVHVLVPAAPLHAHLPPDGRIRGLLSTRPTASSSWTFTRLRRSPSKESPRRRWWSASASSAIAAPNMSAPSIAASTALATRRRRMATLVLTLGAGNVWQAGDKLLGRCKEGQRTRMARESQKTQRSENIR